MASAEYYFGSQGAQLHHNQQSPALYPPQAQPQPQYQQQVQPPQRSWKQQQLQTPSYSSTPPPSYSPYSPQCEKQQMQAYPPPPPPQQQQYLQNGYQGATAPYFPPPPQQNGMLGPPLQHVRSHSQPAGRVRFADQESTALGSESDSDSDKSRHRRRRRHRSREHTHSNDRSRDAGRDSDYSDRDYEQYSSHRTKTHQKKHDNRDTFLGAGAGGIIGDAIFPGLGTAAGLIIGGLGGRKYAKDKKRSHSEEGRPHRHRDAYREGREEGREDREHGRHRYRDAYYEGRDERRRDKARDSGYGYDDRDSESAYGREDGYSKYEGHKHRGQHRKYGQQGWDEGTATFKSGTVVR